MRTGYANLPLHGGKAPRWLFQRMTKLAREITICIVEEYGPGEMLTRLSDPFWFQAFGCVLGFDWHSSGVTTTACGAIKQGLKDVQRSLGLFVAGGKGGTSRKTPGEIAEFCEGLGLDAGKLAYASRMTAKVDSAAVQDGYQLYHHNFFFTGDGRWTVVQQGMNDSNGMARRYHWLSDSMKDFTCEPHAAVCCDSSGECLNMVAEESQGARDASASLARERPETVEQDLRRTETLVMPRRHEVVAADINPSYFHKVLLSTYERQPQNFEQFLAIEGVGAKTVRAISLVAELIHGQRPSFRDPARFSFAHGGKDGHPYPVDRAVYDKTIEILSKAIGRGRLSLTEKNSAVARLRSHLGS